MALGGNLALITAGNQGKVYAFDAAARRQLRTFTAPEFADGFRGSVALCASRALVGAALDDELDSDFGSAFLIQPVAGPFPMQTVAVLNDFAPGAPETAFSTFGDAVINSDGEVMFPAMLVGSGAAAGKNLGVWSTLALGQPLDLAMRSGVDLEALLGDAYWHGKKATGLFNPISNQPSFGLFQATLSGPGITPANNRGIFGDNGTTVRLVVQLGFDPRGSVVLAVRKGDPVAGQAVGVVWNSLRSFWGMDVVGTAPDPVIKGQILFLATLRGPGVTSGNDTALCLLEESQPPSVRILLREGDPAPDCGGSATIGSIQRVVAIPFYAQYAVLVALAHAPSSTNQALYRGATVILPRTSLGALRMPFLALRKGTLYQSPTGSTTALKSISLPASALDATGAGGKGLGMPINRCGEMVLKLTITDTAVELMKGTP